MAKLPIAYIETTIPSYLTSRPSSNLIIAAHQQITREWWQTASQRYQMVISDVVLAEASAGDPAMAQQRMAILANLPSLPPSTDAAELAENYDRVFRFPVNLKTDLLHLAYAVIYGVDYLVTWNCAHLANPHIVRQVERINQFQNRQTPLIITPEDMLEWEKEH